MKSGKSDPRTYAAMLEPYASNDEATAAYSGFFEELYELRKKYRIPDLYFVAEMHVLVGEKVGSALLSGHIGNPTRKTLMAAYGFGEAKAEHEADMLEMQADGARRSKR